jgi:hypothetical protein
LEQYGEKILLEAIASAPLHRVGDHYYFEPEELIATIRARKARAARVVGRDAASPASNVRYV